MKQLKEQYLFLFYFVIINEFSVYLQKSVQQKIRF